MTSQLMFQVTFSSHQKKSKSALKKGSSSLLKATKPQVLFSHKRRKSESAQKTHSIQKINEINLPDSRRSQKAIANLIMMPAMTPSLRD